MLVAATAKKNVKNKIPAVVHVDNTVRPQIVSRSSNQLFYELIKEFYNLKGWSYREYKLNENFTRDQFYKEFGSGSTFPQLVVDGQKTGGCNESISHFKSRGII